MKRVFVRIVAFAAVLWIFSGCKKSTEVSPVSAGSSLSNARFPQQSAEIKKSPNDGSQDSFRDESQYIVKTIVSDLAQEVFFAAHHTLPNTDQFSVEVEENTNAPTDRPVYEVEIYLGTQHPVVRTELKVDGPIWSPDVYNDFTKLLASAVRLSNSKAPGNDSSALLAALTDGKASTIETENENLSSALQKDFTNERLHENAAMLLSAFALRDHAYNFSEISGPLCRITTHLCVAHYLSNQKQLGIAGQVAEAALFTLMNNETDALKRIHEIEAKDQSAAVWLRVLDAYNTDDYRNISKAEANSPIERIAWFYAYCEAVNVNLAWNKLSHMEKTTPDFDRIALGESTSVETGHELLQFSLALEIKELAAVYQFCRKQELQRDELIHALNELPENGCIANNEVKIISWGQWADFFQRHICNAIERNYRFIKNQWAEPDAAKEFSEKTEKSFSNLRLYPFVHALKDVNSLGLNNIDPERLRIVTSTPQLVPGRCWTHLYDNFSYISRLMTNSKTGLSFYGFAPPEPIEKEAHWHKHLILPGTAYGSLSRIDFPYIKNSSRFAALADKLHAICPFNQQVSSRIFEYRYDDGPTYEQAEALFRPVLAYSSSAMLHVAEALTNQPQNYEKLMLSAAEIDPSGYYELGNYFKARKEDDKAADYFEKENQYDLDSVRASHNSDWLAKYYLGKNETNKAERVVDAAAETYSEAGLQAKVNFLTAIGKQQEASEWTAKIEERYGHASSEDMGPAERVATPVSSPHAPVTLSDFHEAPTDGVQIQQEDNTVRNLGLGKGDVIVAIDSFPIHNFGQYLMYSYANSKPEIPLIVWHNNQYREFDVNRIYPEFQASGTNVLISHILANYYSKK